MKVAKLDACVRFHKSGHCNIVTISSYIGMYNHYYVSVFHEVVYKINDVNKCCVNRSLI